MSSCPSSWEMRWRSCSHLQDCLGGLFKKKPFSNHASLRDGRSRRDHTHQDVYLTRDVLQEAFESHKKHFFIDPQRALFRQWRRKEGQEWNTDEGEILSSFSSHLPVVVPSASGQGSLLPLLFLRVLIQNDREMMWQMLILHSNFEGTNNFKFRVVSNEMLCFIGTMEMDWFVRYL